MKPIISVENLGKKYVIRHEGNNPYKSLREEIFKLPQKILSRQEEKEEFWALKDVNFDIMPGDRVGIIGRNGAGKSTLLKLLSRITEPSIGRITMRGRVSSLLEVGTGFHPELTGRENIYLNGAILGMTRAEVRRKFDEIVDFAGVEKFLDTPVKRYSSGMYVRLAFAVAAHLEPEILVVDEVLAVGDAEFQKKCLGKMEEVSKGQGRTVLFVSHNMNMIRSLCKRGLLLREGVVQCDAYDIASVTSVYLQGEGKSSSFWKADSPRKIDCLTPLSMKIVDEDGMIVSSVHGSRDSLYLVIEFELHEIASSFTIGCACFDQEKNDFFWSYTTDAAEKMWPKLKLGKNTLKAKLPQGVLNKGTYTFHLMASYHFIKWIIEPGQGPSVSVDIDGGYSDSPFWQVSRPSVIAPTLVWNAT
ncbi:ABC transporter ATP-binding protein [Desulfovibrio sp. QI0442]